MAEDGVEQRFEVEIGDEEVLRGVPPNNTRDEFTEGNSQ
jgi:hypothetical protein